MPMSLWMARSGRRRGFMTGALDQHRRLRARRRSRSGAAASSLYCVATAVIGIYNAIGLQYRFAAAEVAAPADKAKAISLVLAGGVVGGFLGPEIRAAGATSSRRRSWASFVVLAGVRARRARRAIARPRPAADAGGALGRRAAAVASSCASPCSSSPCSPARSATAS